MGKRKEKLTMPKSMNISGDWLRIIKDFFNIRDTRFRKTVMVVLLVVIITSIAYQIAVKPDLANITTSPEDTTSQLIAEGHISLYTVAKKKVNDKLDILGQIIFHEKVSISSKVTGRLEKIYVQEGKKVRKGELIAEVERLPLKLQLMKQQSDLDIAKKAYELTRAKYENAVKAIEIKLKTIQKAKAGLYDKKVTFENMDQILKNKLELYKIGGISETELKSVKTKHTTLYTEYQLAVSDYEIQQVGYRDQDIRDEGYKIPKSHSERMKILKKINTKIERAELESSRSQISQARNNIKSTKLMLQETYVRSPIDGIIAAKGMSAGEMIKADSVIATVIDISKVFLAMNVNEKQLSMVSKGQKVEFTVDALGNQSFNGIITRITPVLDAKTRTVEIKAEVSNIQKKLLPGMFARAQILSKSNDQELLLVPASALINREDETATVYLVKKGLVFKQTVFVGKQFKTEVEITKGLNEQDIIITKGINVVYPGMKIKNNKMAHQSN